MPGKCALISCALTIIERVLLDQRPAFMVRAGQRGGGKTTTLHMLSMATLGHRAAAAAWSPNAEERRKKAIFAYLIQGVAFLIWDNLPRGLAVSDANLEKVLTSSGLHRPQYWGKQQPNRFRLPRSRHSPATTSWPVGISRRACSMLVCRSTEPTRKQSV